jgi:hypothetical protein
MQNFHGGLSVVLRILISVPRTLLDQHEVFSTCRRHTGSNTETSDEQLLISHEHLEYERHTDIVRVATNLLIPYSSVIPPYVDPAILEQHVTQIHDPASVNVIALWHQCPSHFC